MKINLNSTVTVQLTRVGAAILNDKNRQFKEMFPTVKINPKTYEKGDDYYCQLYDLMTTFGKYLYVGCDMPFTSSCIEINDEDILEANQDE